MPDESFTGSLVKFYFKVTYKNIIFFFQEISGLDIQFPMSEYRDMKNPPIDTFDTIKFPLSSQAGNITLKRGSCNSTGLFLDLYKEFNTLSDTLSQSEMVIELLDESGDASMVWNLLKAYPVSINVVDLNSPAIAIMVMEISFNAFAVVNK